MSTARTSVRLRTFAGNAAAVPDTVSSIINTGPVSSGSESTIADRVRRLMPDLPGAERRVARTLLANYPVAGLETVARVAKKSGTSGPTVLRLATRLGFSGYAELQQALRDELDARGRSPLSAYAADAPVGGDVPAIAAELLSAAVRQTVGRVERSDFDRAVELLLDPRAQVMLTGGRFSMMLAHYFTNHLHQLRAKVTAVDLADRVPALLDVHRRDVVVVFDFRRYQADTVHFGRMAAEEGARLILITDPWMSPLAALADVVITADVVAPSPFDSMVPALAVVETLVSGVVARQGDAPTQRIARYDRFWSGQFDTFGRNAPDSFTDERTAGRNDATSTASKPGGSDEAAPAGKTRPGTRRRAAAVEFVSSQAKPVKRTKPVQ